MHLSLPLPYHHDHDHQNSKSKENMKSLTSRCSYYGNLVLLQASSLLRSSLGIDASVDLRKTCPHENCNRMFSADAELQKHLVLHQQGLYKYFCEYCGKGFAASTNLRGHVASKHTKVQEFKCLACNKAYTYKNSLVNHLRAHEECMKRMTSHMEKPPE